MKIPIQQSHQPPIHRIYMTRHAPMMLKYSYLSKGIEPFSSESKVASASYGLSFLLMKWNREQISSAEHPKELESWD